MDIYKARETRQYLTNELLRLRKDVGYWEGSLGSDIQSTAAAIMALRSGGNCELATNGIKFLESCQNNDGGWGFAPGITSDLDSSIAALSALLMCADEDRYKFCIKNCQNYCEDYDFKTKQLLSNLLMFFSGIETDIKLPKINTESLPHPEKMMFDLATGLKSQNKDLIMFHSKSVNGLRSWRGLTAITGIAYLSLLKIGVNDEMTKQWIEKSQNPDGGFPHTSSLAVWDTVIASLGLIDAGIDPASSDWLISVQDIAGGWYWDAESRAYVDFDDIGYALLVLLKSGYSPSDYKLSNTIHFIRDNQNIDGGFPTFEKQGMTDNRPYWNCSVPDVTSHVLLALKTANLNVEAEKAEEWLYKNSKGGIWTGFWFKDDLYSIKSVLEAINIEFIDINKIQKYILSLQNDDGSFGSPESSIEETAWGISTLIESNTDDMNALDLSFDWLCEKVNNTLKPSNVGALPLFNKRYSDSIFPIAFALDAYNKYLNFGENSHA